MAVRPAILLPPKRLSTPRSARHLSTTDRGPLLGAPVPTQAGLTPAGLVQLAGRNTTRGYPYAESRPSNSLNGMQTIPAGNG